MAMVRVEVTKIDRVARRPVDDGCMADLTRKGGSNVKVSLYGLGEYMMNKD